MKRRFSLRRAGVFALATGLLFMIGGDRGVTQIPQGIDPLEVLNLQIRPNVGIIVDTSGSMTETPLGNGTLGDHALSKMYQAKQVLKQVITDNQDKVNFMFGTYLFQSTPTWTRCPGGGCTGGATNDSYRINGTPVRFRYATQSWSVGLPAGPADAMGVSATEASLTSLYAWQWIQNSPTIQNNQFRFTEGATTCTATIPVGFYTAATIGPALAAAMDPCGPNTYTVTWNAAGTGRFEFTRSAGTADFTLLWTDPLTTFDGPVRATTNQSASGNPRRVTTANDARINLLSRTTTDEFGPENYDPDGAAGPSGTRNITTHWLRAQKLWNGETIQVDGAGVACNIIAGVPTANPTVTLQRVSGCGGAVVSTNVFTWSGGAFGGQGSCQSGFQQRVPFFRCDAPTGVQSPAIQPFFQNQLPLDGTGGLTGYTEANDGTGRILTNPTAGGIVAAGNTPMAQSIDGFRTLFGGAGGLWSAGQGLPFPQNLSAISTHPNPKERTIVLLVTDGDQNCPPFVLGGSTLGAPYAGGIIQSDGAALGAAMATQRLYDPAANGTGAGTVNGDGTINGDPGASVTTYVIGFGNGGQINRLNWIAWGGSGMRRAGANVGTYSGSQTWTTIPTAGERNACKTCTDAFIAPDAATLADVLNKLLNQGATTGEFTAQQSLSDSVFEYVGEAPTPSGKPAFLATNPGTRYGALSPVRLTATFSMPLFTGQIRAFTNDGPDSLAVIPEAACQPGTACERWNANTRLVNRVSSGMAATCTAVGGAGVLASQCNFKRLSGAPLATDLNIAASTAAIKRRIYTTSQNGSFGPTVDQLLLGQSPFRIAIWPPQSSAIPIPVAPANNTQQGLLDVPLGLPADTAPPLTHLTLFNSLQANFKACRGAPLPAACAGSNTQKMLVARREAREMILAFMAGAQFVPDINGDPKRALATVGPDYTAGEIIYQARTNILTESTLATPAVIGPPAEEEPKGTNWVDEWKLYRDGPRCAASGPCSPVTAGGTGFNPDSPSGALIKAGFGLRNPDSTTDAPTSGVDSFGRPIPAPDGRTNLKPVMTVVYVGTNSGLHAFRAGPNVAIGPNPNAPGPPDLNTNVPACVPGATTECGGEELWAFVPFDQLGKLQGRYLNNPQKRTPHDYMISRAVRFSDVFVSDPGTAADPGTGPVTKNNVAGTTISLTVQGVWRKVIYFGRGIGGNYLTAIDVTAPGAFTKLSLDTTGPIVLWNRGNPDTNDGQPQGGGNLLNNGQPDYDAYLRMGQTWSVPAIAWVDRGVNVTGRKPSGVDFVAYAGSGYGTPAASPPQGTTFYTLDALTGDVIKSADVGFRTGMAYENAIVANPAGFNSGRFTAGDTSRNEFLTKTTRIYFGDVHGRVWKVLASSADVAIPLADLGSNQAVGTPVAILGLPPDDATAPAAGAKFPHVMVTSGNDLRATGPFRNFGFKDEGDDTSTTVQAGVSANNVITFPPARSLFTIDFSTNFRGTVQPLVTLNSTQAAVASGRVFFGGTRFNPVGSQFAPPPEPCRSSFDSELFALGVESGAPAYDFGPSVMFRDSRMAAVTVGGSPKGTTLIIDEGLIKSGQPKPPPPKMGEAPGSTTGTSSVVPMQRPGQPVSNVRFGSVVCSE